jgi:hypothetical protein
MSVLKPGDESMHYSDGSHRWVAPAGDTGQWRARVQAHVDAHRDSPDSGHSPGPRLGERRPR